VRLLSFHILRYGPLSYREPVTLGRFNLFHGNNEDGKTLTIDALVKLLLGRKIRDFRAIDRVEEEPEGFVVLEDGDGTQLSLPRAGDLATLTGITPSECCNVFVVRNSDLSIAEEGEFFTGITDRLTGLRMEEIGRIKQELMELARVTPTGAFRDIKGEKLKSRLDQCRSILQRLEPLAAEVIEEQYDTLVFELVRAREGMAELEHRLLRLESARRREQFERGSLAVEALERASTEHGLLRPFSEEEHTLWRDAENSARRLEDELRGLEEELSARSVELSKDREGVESARRMLSERTERKNRVCEELNPLLAEYEKRSIAHAGGKARAGFFRMLFIASAALAGVSIPGAFLVPGPPFTASAFFFGIGAILSAFLLFRSVRQGAWLARTSEKLKARAARFGLAAGSVPDVSLRLRELEKDVAAAERKLEKLRVNEAVAGEHVSRLTGRNIPEHKHRLAGELETVAAVRKSSRTDSLELYSRKLARKKALMEEIGRQEGVLTSLFGNPDQAAAGGIPFWKTRLGELRAYADEQAGVPYSESELQDARRTLQATRQRASDIEERMRRISGRLAEIERAANQVLDQEEGYLRCETSVDLSAVADRLRSFIELHERERDEALEVLRIFSEIESEKRHRVSALFGERSAVSHYFGRITDGRYTGVQFRPEESAIAVVRSDGRAVSAAKLSAGTYDQLYLSIRLALGEQLLKEGKGFFIMDDPFLRSDSARLGRQLEALQRIAALGWQILYFSAKEEVKQHLEGKKEVVLIPLPGTFSG
jgi:exonuclease SbcC